MERFISTFFAICALSVNAGNQRMEGNNGVFVEVLGQSGKVYMGQHNDSVQITMDGIWEMDADGNTVHNSHSFNNFASQEFSFSPLINGTFDSGVDFSKTVFTSSLFDDTVDLKCDIYLMLDTGIVEDGNATYFVTDRSFKFSYTIDNWPWCTEGGTGNNECKQGSNEKVGEYLDVAVILKGVEGVGDPVSSFSEDNTAVTIEWEDGTLMSTPTEYFVDGVWNQMPAGYPLIESSGGKTTMTLRFNRYGEGASLYYDPGVNLGATGDDAFINASFGYFDVKGRSGKIDMGKDENHTIQVTMDGIWEKDASEGKVGGNTHSFNNFAKTDFTFGAVIEDEWNGVDYVRVTFDADLMPDVQLSVYMYMFKEAGSVTDGNTTYTVDAGAFKFAYYISSWPFCTAGGSGATLCEKGATEEVGEYLDFSVILKGGVHSQGTPTITTNDDDTITFLHYSDGNVIIMPNEYTVDGVYYTMPVGYPLLANNGNKTTLTLRFTRFEGGPVYYDPGAGDSETIGTLETPVAAPVAAPVATPVAAPVASPVAAPVTAPHKPKPKPKPKAKPSNPTTSMYPTMYPTVGSSSQSEELDLSAEKYDLQQSDVFASHMLLTQIGVILVVCVIVGVVAVLAAKLRRRTHDLLPQESEIAVDEYA